MKKTSIIAAAIISSSIVASGILSVTNVSAFSGFGQRYKIVSPSGKLIEKCEASNSGFVCENPSGKILYKVVFY